MPNKHTEKTQVFIEKNKKKQNGSNSFMEKEEEAEGIDDWIRVSAGTRRKTHDTRTDSGGG